MFFLSKQEKLCLIVFFCIIFNGLFLRTILKKYPHLKDVVNVVDNELFYPKVDINIVDEEGLKQIPGIGEYTARAIIDYRKRSGRINSLDEMKSIPGVYLKNFMRFKPYLRVSR